jgi:AraC-like DNA-binding protein
LAYKEYLPNPLLKNYVDCYWSQSSSGHEIVKTALIDKILPDGCIDIIFRKSVNSFGVLPIYSYVVGTMTTAIDVPRGQDEIVAVRFRPGGAVPFLNITAHSLTDDFLELTSILGDRTRSLGDKIFSEQVMLKRIQLLECFLVAEIDSRIGEKSNFSKALSSIENTYGLSTIDQLSHNWGKSTRQLERLFLNHVGVTPKTYLKVKRFQGLIHEFKTSAHQANWVDFAIKYGYFDQSHLIRDCKTLTRLTPEKYRLFLKMSHFSNTDCDLTSTSHGKGE